MAPRLLAHPARDRLPGPDGNAVLGHLRPMGRDVLGFIEDLRRDHGDLVRFRVGHLPYVLVSDPSMIEEVLVHQHKRVEKHDFMRKTLGDALGEGLLTAEGETWLHQRKLAQPAFRPKRVRAYADTFVDHTRDLAHTWRDGQVVPTDQAMMELTLRIAAKTLFDVDLAAKTEAIGQALDDVMERFRPSNRLAALLPPQLPTRSNLRYLRGVRRINHLVDDLVEARQRQRSGGNDLLSHLLSAGDALSRERLREELVTLLVAGHETTALTLTWGLDLLARHPEAQARLQDDLDAVLDGRAPRAQDLDQLPYLEAVVDETMRVYPPVWAIGREVVEPMELGGVEMPVGVQLMMSQWLVHRDGRLFEQPLVFEPDRWLDGSTDELPRYAYFPFGGGPRTCIGNTFAVLEAQLVLATLLQRFHLSPVDPQPPEPEPTITLRTGPTRVRIRVR